jgi:hypothetical protein
MIFSLEATDAAAGDCLLLHYGEPARRRVMLIDGGPRGNYKRRLKGRLDQLRGELGLTGPIPLELVMVSHIDDDHIAGVLDLVRECADALDLSEDPPCHIKRLWHNGFGALLGQEAEDAAIGVTAAELPLRQDTQAVVASVGQGTRLQTESRRLRAELNAGRELVSAPEDGVLELDVDGIALTVVAPAEEQIDALRELWARELAKRPDGAAAVAAYADTGVPNLSSIVVHVEFGGCSMLLTGDARGDLVLKGLERAGLMSGGVLEVDLLKLPHHGSDRNVETDFFRRILARHYVISADGKHGNPEDATLLMIQRARGDSEYTVHFTNRDGPEELGERLRRFLDEQEQVGHPFPASFRDEAAPSLTVDLLDPLPA